MPNVDDRQLIRDAMDRLLLGTAIRSDGALTVVALAQEAGIKRHLLTHRHTDLREEFYDRVRRQGHVPESEIALRRRLAKSESVVGSLRADMAGLTAEVALLRRMNNVLEVEKAALEEALSATQSDKVTSIFGDRNKRTSAT